MDAVNLLLLVLSCLSMTLILSGYPTSTELLVRPQQMLYPNNGQLPLLLFVVSEPYLQLLRWSATMGTTISWRVADNNGAINPARACHDARVGLNYQAPALSIHKLCQRPDQQRELSEKLQRFTPKKQKAVHTKLKLIVIRPGKHSRFVKHKTISARCLYLLLLIF